VYEVYVAASFEAAHRLVGNFGPATRMHGHTYRLEARGTELRLLVDGAVLLETHEARVLADGRVGVFSGGEQVTVRRFAVIAL